MIAITTRQRDLLQYLFTNYSYVTLEQLARRFNVGKRTVWNDLKQLDAFLKLEASAFIDSKPGLGIKLVASETEIKLIKEKLKTINLRVLTATERVLLSALLLLANEEITFDLLANACRVSRQTVIRSFSKVQDLFIQNNLSIDKKQGKGVSVVGDEFSIRKLFELVLLNPSIEESIGEIIYEYSSIGSFSFQAQQLIAELNDKLNTTFVDSKKAKVIIEFCMVRINSGHLLDIIQVENEGIDVFDEVIARYIVNRAEQVYVKNILFFTRLSHINTLETKIDDDASKIATYLLERLHLLQETNEEVIKQIIDGFTQHLRIAIYRIKNKIVIKNELLNQIKISIPLIYEFTKNELIHCEREFEIEFDENEIAYISMYISSIYENSLAVNASITVLLVCSFGLATSSILKSRIIPIIPNCTLIGPHCENDAIEYCKNHKIDLIISTHELSIDGIKTIKVNPLLYPEDVDYIKSSLFQLSYQRMCDLFIKSYTNLNNSREVVWLRDYVSFEDIQLVEHQDSWQEAIKLAAKPLLIKSKIEQSYVNKMIDAVNQFGTYMVLVDGIAFIHAGTNDGINENCTAILVIKNPIAFGDKNTKIVRCLVILGIQNKEENSLLNLVCVFENKLNLLALDNKNITLEQIFNMHN